MEIKNIWEDEQFRKNLRLILASMELKGLIDKNRMIKKYKPLRKD
jgi:hypothetical protein